MKFRHARNLLPSGGSQDRTASSRGKGAVSLVSRQHEEDFPDLRAEEAEKGHQKGRKGY